MQNSVGRTGPGKHLKYEDELERAIGDCKSVLDVGCGASSPIRNFSDKFYCVGVDAFGPSIQKSREQDIHDEYHEMDVLEIEKKFNPRSFDCVLASDLIEHLDKKNGLELIRKLENISGKKVIIFTPNGYFVQDKQDQNPWQLHRSGWTASEMTDLGYDVIGINGWKPLRGAQAAIRFKPKKFWKWFAKITQLFVRNRPWLAFQILCTKEVKDR